MNLAFFFLFLFVYYYYYFISVQECVVFFCTSLSPSRFNFSYFFLAWSTGARRWRRRKKMKRRRITTYMHIIINCLILNGTSNFAVLYWYWVIKRMAFFIAVSFFNAPFVIWTISYFKKNRENHLHVYVILFLQINLSPSQEANACKSLIQQGQCSFLTYHNYKMPFFIIYFILFL